MFKVAKGLRHYFISAGARPIKINRTPELDRAFFEKKFRPFEAAREEVKGGVIVTHEEKQALKKRLQERFPGHKIEVNDRMVICGQIKIPLEKIGPIPVK